MTPVGQANLESILDAQDEWNSMLDQKRHPRRSDELSVSNQPCDSF
jgi:hypothetical protein